MARMPYTNFHELNQDWIIRQIKTAYTADNPPPYPVTSVNGQTGNVNLNSDNIIDVASGVDLTDALRAKQDRPAINGTQGQVLGLDNQLNPVWLNQPDISGKQDAPATPGTAGQVLGLNNNLDPVWVNQNPGVTAYDDLTGKPKINNVTLSGEMDGADLGLLDAPATAGTAGQVLTSDGNGGQSWQTPASPAGLYAPIIEDTASGDIVAFPDGINNMPMAVDAQIVPVQDLHGYANPWPGGGGVNKLKLTGRSIITSAPSSNTSQRDFTQPYVYIGISMDNYFVNSRVNNYSITEKSVTVNSNNTGYGVGFTFQTNPNTTYTISYKNQLINYLGIGFYDIDGTYISYKFIASNNDFTFTTPANCVNMIIVFRPATLNIDYLFDEPMLELGSTASTYSPYSNICPISGRAGMALYHTGINIWDEETEAGNILANGADGTNNTYLRTGYIPVVPGISYYRKGPNNIQPFYYDLNKTFISYDVWGINGVRTIPANAYFMRFQIDPAYGTTYNNDISINYPSTDTAYHAYNGEDPVLFAWGDVAGTVYGGKVTINRDGSVTLTVDSVLYTINGSSLSLTGYSSSGEFYYGYIPSSVGVPAGFDGQISNYLRKEAPSATAHDCFLIYTSNLIRLNISSITQTVSEYQQYLNDNNLQVFFQITNPVTYNLPSITAINSFFADNNIFTDVGPVTADYYADTKLFILKVV